MSSILGQIHYPVFLYCVILFFVLGSIFSFIVGVSYAMRNVTMLRIFDYLNKRISTRRMLKPIAMPRYIEPVLLKRPNLLGAGIILGAASSIFLLIGADANVFQHVYRGQFSYGVAEILSAYTKTFLLIGNGICVAVGLLILFFPHLLSSIEAYTDKWLTLRKQTRPLDQMHYGVDKWAMAHPTVFGTTLSILSLGLFATMYVRI